MNLDDTKGIITKTKTEQNRANDHISNIKLLLKLLYVYIQAI